MTRIKSVKAQDLKVGDLVIFYDDPDGDGEEFTTYKVEAAKPEVVVTLINRFEVISLDFLKIESGDFSNRQVHPEYEFRILVEAA